MQHRVNHNRTK